MHDLLILKKPTNTKTLKNLYPDIRTLLFIKARKTKYHKTELNHFKPCEHQSTSMSLITCYEEPITSQYSSHNPLPLAILKPCDYHMLFKQPVVDQYFNLMLSVQPMRSLRLIGMMNSMHLCRHVTNVITLYLYCAM